jgi:DNA repair protein RecN (Recombination protein N)
MLQTLSVRNLATVESARIEFGPGLTALTGETGAGKSILVGGLELALGERAGGESIRPGATLASAEAVFDGHLSEELAVWMTSELGLEWAPGAPLALRRELSRTGRNRCFINDQVVQVADLKRLGEALVDFHGQHEHQSLLRAAAPRRALDAFADHPALLMTYGAQWQALSRLRARRRELEAAAADFERRLEYLTYQLDELEKLNPRPGESASLEQEETLLARADALARAAAEGFALLYEGLGDEQPSALGRLAEVARRVAEIAEVDPAFAAYAARLEDHKAGLEDLAWAMRDFAERVQSEPARLDEVIGRREALRALIRKHGGDEEKLFAAWEALRAERDAMTRDDAERREMTARLAETQSALRQAGEKLAASRRKAAEKMKRQIERLLGDLAMDKARFEISFVALTEPGAGGLEEVDFLLAANPGLPAAALRKVASGGELSRVMLALKSILAGRDAIPTLIFDEIDAGVSGETSRRVGKVMEKLGASHQILCITHHAPIAARAGRQIEVRKTTRRGSTFSEVAPLEGDARLDALARMMGGDAAGEEARKLARRLMA